MISIEMEHFALTSRFFFSHAKILGAQLVKDKMKDELGWYFVNLTLDEDNWTQQVENKLGGIIWSHLSKGQELVAKALRKGFFLSVKIAPASESTKNIFMSGLKQLTPKCLKIALLGSCSIEPEQFLK